MPCKGGSCRVHAKREAWAAVKVHKRVLHRTHPCGEVSIRVSAVTKWSKAASIGGVGLDKEDRTCKAHAA